MRYGQRVELARNGPRVIYRLPETVAFGLANYSEKDRISMENFDRKLRKAIRKANDVIETKNDVIGVKQSNEKESTNAPTKDLENG